ncbi:MAG: hypothetical protein ACQEVA_18565 [Myxococcota bacterium]
MSNKIGKTIENRLGWGRWVAASVDTHLDSISGALSGRGGMNKSEWKQFLKGQRDEMKSANTALFGAESELAQERADDPAAREARDVAAATMYEALIRARSLMEAVKVGESVRFGLDGRTPRGASSLLAFAQNAVDSLRNTSQSLGTLGIDIDTTTLADQLQPALDGLTDAVDTMATEEREAEATLVERDKVLERWERTYRSIARILEGVYRMAGEDDLADRVRPTIRRATGAEDPEDEVDVEPIVDGGEDAGDEPIVAE